MKIIEYRIPLPFKRIDVFKGLLYLDYLQSRDDKNLLIKKHEVFTNNDLEVHETFKIHSAKETVPSWLLYVFNEKWIFGTF
jgi:hypothetical protein